MIASHDVLVEVLRQIMLTRNIGSAHILAHAALRSHAERTDGQSVGECDCAAKDMPFGRCCKAPRDRMKRLADEDIAAIAERLEASDPADSFWREFARAIEQEVIAGVGLPDASPVARGTYRLLTTADTIQRGDECLSDDTATWLPLAGWEVGMAWHHGLMPLRRRTADAIAEATGS